jgi:hypothetical protein
LEENWEEETGAQGGNEGREGGTKVDVNEGREKRRAPDENEGRVGGKGANFIPKLVEI